MARNPLGNLAPTIARFTREGLNRAQALGAFRRAGGRIATDTWNRLWGLVRASIRQRAQVAAVDPSIPISDARVGEWRAGRAGQWALQVEVVLQHPELGTFVRPFTMISDRLVSAQVAVDTAIAEYEAQAASADPDNPYRDQEIVGAVVTGVFRMTGSPE